MKTEDIKVQMFEGKLYITVPDAMEHMSFIISSEDGQLRKGVEVGICPKCGEFKNLACSTFIEPGKWEDYCFDCEVEQSGLKCPECDGTGIRKVKK